MRHWNAGSLTTSLQSIVRAGTSEYIIVKEIWIANYGASSTTVDIMIQRSGEDAKNDSYLIKNHQVRNNNHKRFEQTYICLTPGDSLLASAADNSLIAFWAFGDVGVRNSFSPMPTISSFENYK